VDIKTRRTLLVVITVSVPLVLLFFVAVSNTPDQPEFLYQPE